MMSFIIFWCVAGLLTLATILVLSYLHDGRLELTVGDALALLFISIIWPVGVWVLFTELLPETELWDKKLINVKRKSKDASD